MKYDLKGHPRSYKTSFVHYHFSTFVYGPILMKIYMNANITKTQFFHKIIYGLNFHFYVMKKFVIFFTLAHFDLITTLNYVLRTTYVLVFYLFKRSKPLICILSIFLHIYQDIDLPLPELVVFLAWPLLQIFPFSQP